MKNEASQTETPQSLAEEIASLKATVAKLTLLVEYYESQLLQAKRHQFGSSSEKSGADDRQLNLFGEAESVTAPPAETEEIHYKRKKRKGKREEDLSGLPVERIDYELPEAEHACPQCGETMRDIGVDIRRELELIPAKVIVVEHAAHAYACKKCGQTGEATPVVKAKVPAPLIAGSLASPSLVSHIAVQKYMNAMPLYRMEKGFAYDGVTVSCQNMANWVIKCSLCYRAMQKVGGKRMMYNVYVYVLDTLADWELDYVTAELNSGRFFKKDAPQISLQTVSYSKEPIKTMGGLTITPDCVIDDMIMSEAGVLLLPGADTWNDQKHGAIIEKASELLSVGATGGAICGATTALAGAGLLDNRPHTSNGVGFLDMFAPNYKGQRFYIDEPAIADNNLITAGCTGGLLWAKYILERLGVFAPDTLEAWYNYFSIGKAEHFFALMQALPSNRDNVT